MLWLLLPFVYLFKCTTTQFAPAPPVETPLKLKVGLLIPKDDPDLAPKMGYRRTAAAVSLAFDRILYEQMLPSDTNFTIVWRTEECQEITSAGLSFELLEKEDVDMLIASPCNEPAMITSTIGASFNRPVFLWGATTSGEFSQMQRFPTIATVVPNTFDMALTICTMMQEFDWQKFALIYTNTETKGEKCGYLQQDIEKATDVLFGCTISYKRRVVDWHDDRLNTTLEQVKHNARVVVLCFDRLADLRQFLLKIHDHGMDNEEYVYILPDVSSNPSDRLNFYKDLSLNPDNRDNDALQVAKRTLLLDSSLISEIKFKNFSEQLLRRMDEYPFYCRQECSKEVNASTFAALLHDTTILWGLTLNHTMSRNKTMYRNGTQVALNAAGIEFEGMTGTVNINGNSTRDTIYSLSGFDKTNNLQVYMKFIMNERQVVSLSILF
ncbi:hypothetical protein QR680_003500 [Steinernema hermaphroditum]|uniref:Receptor ligand binding region domain-containing protein n=1 Tax=Steinernema hermaphroditum TaxID=289476 RepID=A0AA39LS72_9BILA|nr:hypothetical protein QR680_003500 [Steinernema hermaphroditum]